MPSVTSAQLKLSAKYPQLEVRPYSELPSVYRSQLDDSGLETITHNMEVWVNDSSSRELAYLSHGVFRYFGKFPPTIARHLIENYTKKQELVIDCMCGSGTTGVECLHLERKGFMSDINPLAILLTKVKTTRIDPALAQSTLDSVVLIAEKKLKSVNLSEIDLPGLRNPTHWFLPETMRTLMAIKSAIYEFESPEELRNYLLVVFASVVRKASRATTQQGRLFLDKDTAIENAIPIFATQGKSIAKAIASLPATGDVAIRQLSMLEPDDVASLPQSRLLICHPPYFNLYRYSSINSLELAWLGFSHGDVRVQEIRESFKIGKAEKLSEYVADMHMVLDGLVRHTRKGARIALMIGDTRMHGKHMSVTANLLIGSLDARLEIEKIAIRIPKGTEASWVTSQRRIAHQVGVSLCDYVVVLKRI